MAVGPNAFFYLVVDEVGYLDGKHISWHVGTLTEDVVGLETPQHRC